MTLSCFDYWRRQVLVARQDQPVEFVLVRVVSDAAVPSASVIEVLLRSGERVIGEGTSAQLVWQGPRRSPGRPSPRSSAATPSISPRVSLSTEKADLFLPDVMPLLLKRTYRQADATSRSFGRGSRHDYDMHLWRPNTSSYENVALILPDGKRIEYTCLNPDEPLIGELRFEHTATPTAFSQRDIIQQIFALASELDGRPIR